MKPHSLLDPPTTRSECEAVVSYELGRRAGSIIEADVLASLDDATIATAARRLNRWRKACGCSTGAAFVLAALAFRLFVNVRAGVSGEFDALRDVVVSGGWVLAAAALGKLVGLAAARVCLRLQTERLVRRLARANGQELRHVVLR
ncbi:MAG: hypothetical protein ACXV3B_04975 [Ilumatobacteraceae bacterium]